MEYEQLTLASLMQEPEHFGNRKDLLDSMSLYGTAVYLAACISEMDKGKITDADYWYEFLKTEVDDNGDEL